MYEKLSKNLTIHMDIGCNLFDEEVEKGTLRRVGVTVDEYERFMELKSIEEKLGVDLVKFLTEFAHVMEHHSETVGLTTDGTKIVSDYGYIEQFVNELKAHPSNKDAVEAKQITILSNNAETLNFIHVGVEGTYVLDHVAFMDKFDNFRQKEWDKSSGKRKLQEWAENNLPKEILEQFDVDIPTAEEVFSQKMLNSIEYGKRLKSKQFPIFQNGDNRMMEFNGNPVMWWTRSAHAVDFDVVWGVLKGGSIFNDEVRQSYGFVPILRKRKE